MKAKTKQKLKLTLVRSKYGHVKGHMECVRGLGLHRIGSEIIVEDTPSIRGMVNKVSYLLKVEEVQ